MIGQWFLPIKQSKGKKNKKRGVFYLGQNLKSMRSLLEKN
jgi:hypothetical protein